LIAWENINFFIGHYIIEAKNALQCIVENKTMALETFESLTRDFIENVKEGRKTLNTGLLKWAKEVSKIPIRTTVEKTPKVLIFGGLNLMFDHYPIEEFFLERGIIAKVVDIVESMSLLLAESTIRYGFEKGITSPKEQFNEELLNSLSLNEDERKEAKRAKKSRNTMKFLNSQCKIFRRIIGKSGLLFDSFIHFIDLFEEGNKYVSSNSFTETPLITGRFLYSIR